MTKEDKSLEDNPPRGMHFPSLMAALIIMIGGTIYPWVFANGSGKADHGLATALFGAMSAGLVRGVGFVPKALIWRILFSGWSCSFALVLAAWIRWGH